MIVLEYCVGEFRSACDWRMGQLQVARTMEDLIWFCFYIIKKAVDLEVNLVAAIFLFNCMLEIYF
jgi:hypothetical protein